MSCKYAVKHSCWTSTEALSMAIENYNKGPKIVVVDVDFVVVSPFLELLVDSDHTRVHMSRL